MSELEVKNDTATAEICANRCYQDGCTGARYDPETMECALGYGDHQYCSDDQQYDRFRTNETIWIHCITCKEPLPDDRQFELLVDESEETTKFPEGVLPRRGPLASSVPLDFTTLSSVESTEEVSGESTTHETASTTVEEELTTSAEPPLQAVSDLVDALSQNTKLEEILGLTSAATPHEEPSTSSKIIDDCTKGRLMFIGRSTTPRTSIHFHADATVTSIQHCVRVCYELHCKLAAFRRFPSPTCFLQFDDATNRHACSDDEMRSALNDWPDNGRDELVLIKCVHCENFSIDESVTEREKEIAIPISHIDITNLESTQSRSVPLANQPFIYEGTAVGCPGRLEFQRMSVTALPKLNVTNDVPARTPADCARKCFETEGCSLAGYIPSPTGDPTNGVCVLTSDDEVCLQTKKFVPQHASLSPFVLSCIKCFPCKYTISTVTPERKLPQFEHSEQLLTIGKCAEECSKRKCTAAKYNANTKVCSMSSTERSSKECPHETAVQTDGVLPLLLECVECAS
uniref:Apple domain-containing protein n=2 Tax=Parascaris univalens TaxID=6257 RepID=A0A914ZL66_PARUN